MPDARESFLIEKLDEGHREVLSDFDCGHADINEFTRNDIFEYQKQNIGVSYALLDADGRILSFITLLMGAIKMPSHLGFRIAHVSEVPNQVPALKIGRIGTLRTEQKKGHAKRLIQYALYLAIKLRKEIGCHYLTLDAYPENVPLYQKCGFIPFYSDWAGRETVPMFMIIPPEADSKVP